MTKKNLRVSRLYWIGWLLLGIVSVGTIPFLRAQETVPVQSISHLCVGNVDLNFETRRPAFATMEATSAFNGALRSNENQNASCTVKRFPFESAFGEERIFAVVAKQGAYRMIGYIARKNNLSHKLDDIVERLNEDGFRMLPTPNKSESEVLAFVRKSESLLLIPKPFGLHRQILWVIFEQKKER